MPKSLPAAQPGSTEDAPDEGMLRGHIGFRIHVARRAIRRVLRDQESNERRLPSGAVSILELISRNPGIGPHDLAKILFLDPPKVTVRLSQLDKSGLIDRIPSSTDRRRIELRLTPAGEERLAAARQFSELQERRIARGLSATERAELNRLLHKLQEALE
jgi:DNA-binding MarR family transcriptional regulator